MIEVYINGNKTDVQLESEQTISDVLRSFEITCEENEAAVIGIIVDGKQINAEDFDSEANKPLGENTKFEFSVITKTAIKESFENLSNCFDDLAKKMEKIPVEFQNGKATNVTTSIKELADTIDDLCHIAALASLFPETFTNTTINGMNFNDFFKEFSPVLLDYEQALQSNDTVLIGDLSEYEICPRLQAISEALKNI